MIPFTPTMPTVALAVGTTASAAVSPAAGAGAKGSMSQFILYNTGTAPVWVSVEGAAAIPVAGTPTSTFPVLPGTAPIMTLPTNSSFSAIATVAGNLYITGGTGE